MKNVVYKMSEKEVNNLKIIDSTNKVLIRIEQRNVDQVTPHGILTISECDSDWLPAEHHDRRGVVVAHTHHLKRMKSHLWRTQVEICVGDEVWFDVMTTAKTDTIITEKYTYKIIDYFDLHVAKRDGDIICLNGYCLFSPCASVFNSSLLIPFQQLDARFGIMEYMGSCNGYYFDGIVDDDYLSIGDRCVFSLPPIMLESDSHMFFNLQERYRISQRYNIVAYYRDDVITPTINHVLVEPEYDTHKGLIEIPEIYRQPNGYGRVEFSMVDGIRENERIKYFPGSCTTIESNGKKYQLANAKDILVILK